MLIPREQEQPVPSRCLPAAAPWAAENLPPPSCLQALTFRKQIDAVRLTCTSLCFQLCRRLHPSNKSVIDRRVRLLCRLARNEFWQIMGTGRRQEKVTQGTIKLQRQNKEIKRQKQRSAPLSRVPYRRFWVQTPRRDSAPAGRFLFGVPTSRNLRK